MQRWNKCNGKIKNKQMPSRVMPFSCVNQNSLMSSHDAMSKNIPHKQMQQWQNQHWRIQIKERQSTIQQQQMMRIKETNSYILRKRINTYAHSFTHIVTPHFSYHEFLFINSINFSFTSIYHIHKLTSLWQVFYII